MTKNTRTTPEQRRASILLVDDHPLVRDGIAYRLSLEPDLMVCAGVSDAPSALSAVATHRPAVVVVDISLENGNGLELVKNLKALYPKLPTLVLSMHEESLYAERALHAGAKGYVMKHDPASQLVAAIRRVLGGDVFLSERMTDRVLQRLSGKPRPAEPDNPLRKLSDRELEVMDLLGRGYTSARISTTLHISMKTVAAHRENIKAKLKLADSAELIMQAIHWSQGAKAD